MNNYIIPLFANEKNIENEKFLNIKEASVWTTNYTGKKVPSSNISYLIQYGRIRKHKKNQKDKSAYVAIIFHLKEK